MVFYAINEAINQGTYDTELKLLKTQEPNGKNGEKWPTK